MQTAQPISADDYNTNRETGSFLLIDPQGGNTLGAGLVGGMVATLLPPPANPAERHALNEEPLRRIAAALTYRDFRLLWAGAFTSSIGTWMQSLAENWLVLSLTASTRDLAPFSRTPRRPSRVW